MHSSIVEHPEGRGIEVQLQMEGGRLDAPCNASAEVLRIGLWCFLLQVCGRSILRTFIRMQLYPVRILATGASLSSITVTQVPIVVHDGLDVLEFCNHPRNLVTNFFCAASTSRVEQLRLHQFSQLQGEDHEVLERRELKGSDHNQGKSLP